MSQFVSKTLTKKNKIITVLLVVLFLQFWIIYKKESEITDTKEFNSQKKALSYPNILLISLDACRADHLSSYGYHRNTSPFLDEIAKKGIRFSNAFVNTHGTPPSHTTMLSSLYQETHKVDYYYKKKQRLNTHIVPSGILMVQEILKVHGYTTIGVTTGGYLAKKYGFNRGFIEYADHGGGVALETNKVVKLVRKYKSMGKPIFVFYHTYEIHSPYFPPPEYKELFGSFKSQFIPSSKNLLKFERSAKDLSTDDLNFIEAMYDSEIRYTDDKLKKMFKSLKANGFFENYIVIITSDHGEEFGEHGGLLHTSSLYDDHIKVPLIITGTGIPEGKVSERVVSTVDIVPTILKYAGIKTQTPLMGTNLLGRSLSSNSDEEAVFSQYGNLRYSIRTKKWKFIKNPNTFELYDMIKNPEETINLVDQYPDLSEKFKKRISKWKKKQPKMNVMAKSKVIPDKKHQDQLKSLGYLQ